MPTDRPSYRALLAVPWLGRALASMQVIRIAQSMIGVTLVLFSLGRYGSPAIAGLVTFASIAPGLLISPIGGALLDRHGRVRLILLDLAISALALAIIAWAIRMICMPASARPSEGTASRARYDGGWSVTGTRCYPEPPSGARPWRGVLAAAGLKYGLAQPPRTRTFLTSTSRTPPVATGRALRRTLRIGKATMAMASMAVNELGPMLTATEVAEMLHLHVNTVKRLGDRGELPFYRVCKRGDRRFRLDDVLRFLHQNR